MISQTSNDVIVRMSMEPDVVRFAGVDKRVLRPSARGFSWVEFDSGELHPISHPLEEWLLSLLNNGVTPGTSQIGTVYFIIDTPGDRSMDGQDDRQTSVNNIQTSL